MAEAPKIELRLSEVEPPAGDPRKTIYRDIVNLPNPTVLGITVRYFNYDDVGLYFRVTGSASGYTFGTVNLGLLASGANAYRNLDNFGSRAKPSGELTESIKLILRAYTDAGYTNLKWTYERTVTVIWIDSSDPSYTLDVLNNFDDGTVQGWACACAANCFAGYPYLTVATDYVLSAPYSLKMTSRAYGITITASYYYKSFTTPNRNKVYAIFELRLANVPADIDAFFEVLYIMRDGTQLIRLGWPIYHQNGVPVNKWMRFVTPLPKNTTLQLRIQEQVYSYSTPSDETYEWLDDFKIISKD